MIMFHKIMLIPDNKLGLVPELTDKSDFDYEIFLHQISH